MKLKLVKKTEEAKGTKSFFWEPGNSINFLPGQYFYFTLPALNYPDPRGATRHFTISSSSTEGNLLRLTTRIREESGYKKTLDGLPVGTEIEGEGPNGTFVLDEKEGGNHIFLAGGIGITPFRSFIRYSTDKKLSAPMYLIYSNSDSDFAFGEELKKLDKENGFLQVEFFDSGKSGHLDADKIKKILAKWGLSKKPATWWVVGPPGFIDTMEQALSKAGVTSDKIRSEKFTGY